MDTENKKGIDIRLNPKDFNKFLTPMSHLF